MRFVNHSFGDGPQVVSQISDLLGTILGGTTVVGRHTRHYYSKVHEYAPWTVDCHWQYLGTYVRRYVYRYQVDRRAASR